MPAKPRKSVSIYAILAGFAGFTLLLAALYHASFVPLLGRHLTEVFALLFLFLPTLWFWARHEKDFIAFGSFPRGLMWGLAVAIPLLSGYALVHFLFFSSVCSSDSAWFSLGRSCAHYGSTFHWPLSATASLNLLGVHVIAVALPEEFFYRGFLLPLLIGSRELGRLDKKKAIIIALVIQALLFGLGHTLVDGNPLRMAVFFPGLIFGIVALKTKTLFAPIIIHGLANFVSEILEKGWFST
ncbi:CPBP family intramembrane metalloprotease [Myxococcota bacterium]|nr:CPBP family intramembrane metalloprotease [Myxococcota bacterium]MBU1535134.1 CPBP family intramembrane metalloprotease [Myxococcota bacterium]